MLKFIQTLLASAFYYDYEKWKMDVKIAILNDNLSENIYMEQPNRFIAKDQKSLICKLK